MQASGSEAVAGPDRETPQLGTGRCNVTDSCKAYRGEMYAKCDISLIDRFAAS